MPVTIHNKEYITVAERIAVFREEHPDWTILTEIVSANEDRVVMKAAISDHERILATGYAEEVRASSQINRTSALENCETSAVGRALAFLGLAGTEIASADEVASAIRQQSSMNGTRVDVNKLNNLADKAVEIVDSDDMDAGPALARKLYEPLTNDERMYFNGKLRERKFTNADTGRENQYWSAFKLYLQEAA